MQLCSRLLYAASGVPLSETESHDLACKLTIRCCKVILLRNLDLILESGGENDLPEPKNIALGKWSVMSDSTNPILSLVFSMLVMILSIIVLDVCELVNLLMVGKKEKECNVLIKSCFAPSILEISMR